MIHSFVSTKVQLIKMAPIMAKLKSRGILYGYVDSGQEATIF